MNLDEAIKILEEYLNPDPAKNYKPVADATRLGIEALKRIKAQRIIDPELHQVLLPGETE